MPADPHRLGALVRELQSAAGALPAAITEHIAALKDALAAAHAEAAALRRRLADAEVRADKAKALADENIDIAKAAERALDTALADSGRLRIALASAEDEIARLREAASHPVPPRDIVPEQPRPARGRPVVPDTSPESTGSAGTRPSSTVEMLPATPPAETGPSARIAAAFRAWCGEATPVMGKVEFFAGRVRTALPGALVTAVYRDVQSQAIPIRLERTSGNIPVEHWLVALDGRHWLLPQPMAPAQFRELAPCFEGTATPATLATVAPAEVRVVGDRYEVPTPGRVA